MKLTNKFNLPARIIRLLPEKRQPVEGRIGATSLIDSPRIRTLMLEKWDEIVMDYSDYLNTIIGISVHERNEKFASDEEEAEHKIEHKIDGVDLVGVADNYIPSERLILDTKTKATAFKRFGTAELEQQLNIYAFLQRVQGKDVDHLVADIFYRDWKLWELKLELQKRGLDPNNIPNIELGYPVLPYEELKVPLWSFEKQEQFIKDQLEYHNLAPMDCPAEKRWRKETTWAVKSNTAKKARRVLKTREEAQKYLKEKGGDFIEERPGECTRCQFFCPVRSVCVDSPCYLNRVK